MNSLDSREGEYVRRSVVHVNRRHLHRLEWGRHL